MFHSFSKTQMTSREKEDGNGVSQGSHSLAEPRAQEHLPSHTGDQDTESVTVFGTPGTQGDNW